MKKFLTVLCGGLIALSLFVTTGNTAKAAEPTDPSTVTEPDDCGCHDVTPLFGAERNKIVAKIISGNEFKTAEKNLNKDGFKWNGANSIEVLKHNQAGMIIVGVPFTNKNGNVIMAVFFDGKFMGNEPADSN
ncbi:hypothetical protein [Neobacillus vireti]|uniref:Lipoprotein n=1 Tax=Neobacillus vireti LMG 21834 TaxID=1131730 RepID=A0AB94IP73_9BACI|nr:hypothetical protein [Neobacillus vireti]ETI68876.1 hypothetical protein BAVI_08951 [Neobacillus vireti LMG 21834]KLT15810.1 hypothetical protein AA980_21595 [Neobacillus vireti]